MSKSIFKSFMLVTGFSIATRFLSFIYKIIISRYFGAEAIGIFGMAVSFLGFFMAINSGIPLILSRKIAEGTSKIEQSKNVTFSLIVTILTYVFIAILLLAFSPLLPYYFQNKKAVVVFYLLLPALFSSGFYSIIRAYLLGNKYFLSFSSTEFLEEVLTIILTFLFTAIFAFYNGEIIIALAVTVADITSVLVLFAIYFIKGGKIVKPSFQKELIKNSVPITTNRIISSLTATFSAFIVPYKLIESGLNEMTATAIFGRFTGMCMPLISAPSALIGSLAIVLIPELASLKTSSYNGAVNKIEKSLSFSVIVAGLFVGIYMALGEEITTLVFNDKMSGTYVTYSAIIIFPLVLTQLSTSILNTLNRENTTLKNYIISNIPMLIIISTLTKKLGVLSLAIGFFTSFLINSILNLYTLNKENGLGVKLYKNIVLVLIFTATLGYFIELISQFLHYSNFINILICVVIYVVLYGLLCYFSSLIGGKVSKLWNKK